MRLKGMIVSSVAALGMLMFVSAGTASAKQLCLSFGGPAPYAFNTGKVPAKNKCKPVSMTAIPGVGPTGFLAAGSICTGSDGNTVLLTLSDGFFLGPETLQGEIDKSTGNGSVQDCEAYPTTGTSCDTVAVTVAKCPNQPISVGASSVPGTAGSAIAP
jgi:hypothetical protein